MRTGLVRPELVLAGLLCHQMVPSLSLPGRLFYSQGSSNIRVEPHSNMPENKSACIMAFWEGLVLYFLIPSMDFFHCLRACGAKKTGKELRGQTLELQGDLFVHEPQSKHTSPP